MKIKIIYFLIPLFLIYLGCEKSEPVKEFNCTIGDNYRVTNDLSFSIDSINDSRCPADAMCFWAGDVWVFININSSNTQIDTTMNLINTSRNPILIGDYSFRVLEVTPLTGSGLTTSKDITIKMIITRN